MDKVAQAEKLKRSILEQVKEYYHLAHDSSGTEFIPGKSKVNYGGRVFDERELVNLVDSSLEFWLTYGRYSREFEQRLAEYLGIRFTLLVNSGSSANLLALMALTSPLSTKRTGGISCQGGPLRPRGRDRPVFKT